MLQAAFTGFCSMTMILKALRKNLAVYFVKKKIGITLVKFSMPSSSGKEMRGISVSYFGSTSPF
jgi:hypothetical protein